MVSGRSGYRTIVSIAACASMCAFALASCRTERGERSSSDISIVSTAAISLYRNVITEQDASRCVFTPTCSRYMDEAVKKHGFAGIFMGIDRITRCHPINAASGHYYERLPDGTLHDPVK